MNNTDKIIRENIEHIREKIDRAASKSGRSSSAVKLMAVTKFRSIEEIRSAYGAGIRLFGENRVQEAVEKFSDPALRMDDARLHMIGVLQRNKVKSILPYVSCIHSVDRIELMEEIAKRLQAENPSLCPAFRPLTLLIEVHTGEESKSGFTSEDGIVRALEYAQEANLDIGGFMTMAPLSASPESAEVRRSFVTLREIKERMQKRFPSFSLAELSMGMSSDFETAIEEGSTLVRIGTALFRNSGAEAQA